MVKGMRQLAALLTVVLLLSGCALLDSPNCDHRIDEVRDKYGSPEEVTTYSTRDYATATWWYWSRGFSYTFTWGPAVGTCKVALYTFTPIP